MGTSASPTTLQLVNGYKPSAGSKHRALRENIFRTSAEQWTRPRSELEAKLARFLKREFKKRGK
jgi:hypothetical protein